VGASASGTTPNDTMQRQLKLPGIALGLIGTLLWASVPGTSRAELWFRGLPHRDTYLDPLYDTPVGLPGSWRLKPPASSGPLTYGDPTVSITIDPITGLVREYYREEGVEIREPLVASDADYSRLMTTRTSRRLWRDKFRQNRSIQRDAAGRGSGLFRVELPVQLPKQLRSIFGDGAPSLEVSGSETITLGGKSDWTVHQTSFTGEGRRQGAFPAFEMNQELNVNLTGTIGDKIKVDVDQSSNVQTSLDNKVKLRYEGDEDDMIKSIELGNTNLSLQGASIRQEGLFGVKTAAKLGNVDVVTIASKQEGKNETARFTPSGDRTPVIIRDLDYIKHQYYSLTDHAALINYNTPQKIEIYRLSITANKGGTSDGIARLDPTAPYDSLTNPQIGGDWIQLDRDAYTIEEDHWVGLPNNLKVPVIRLTSPLGESDVLAVAYTEVVNGAPKTIGYGADFKAVDIPRLQKLPGVLLLKVLKQSTSVITDKDGTFQPSDRWYPTLQYELRNFYDLTARNISTTTMTFKIRKRDEGQAVHPDNIDGKPLVEILGLDQTNQANQLVPDGKVDLNFIDAERGILFFPDLFPFDPTRADTSACGGDSIPLGCLRTYRLHPNSLSGENSNPLIYYRRNLDVSDNRYYIEAEFQSSRQGYSLGRFNILEGSEVVKVDNITYKRDTDYRIDYDTGQITFNRVPGPDQVVTVDYSFAPGAGQVQRTLLGFSTSYNPSADLSFSSSLLYEKKGAQEDLVKLGEEPATTLLGDLSTVLAFRPVWMTQLTNKVPGIHTSQQSALNIQGSVSTSVPDPNTKGEAFVDDMEGNRESNTVPLSRTQWFWSSVPVPPSGIQDTTTADHARIQWYNPVGDGNPAAVKEHDLKPVLRDDEGGKTQRQVLAIDVKAAPWDSSLTSQSWTGITLPLATVGQDLSRVQYFEVWINDFRRDHTKTVGKLHLDFGRVSEDAFWDPNHPPNGKLDTEDKNRDGKLDRPTENGVPTPEYEDTGLDGLLDPGKIPAHPELTEPGSGSDPNEDDYAYNANTARDDYSKINNTEGNSLDDPNARPDTEDLNRDGGLDTQNNYFERTIDLADTQFVAIDVPKEFASFPVVMAKETNGWRLYRIPIDSVAQHINSPSWANVQAVRIWLDGMTEPLRLQIGGIEMIGSRWLRQTPRDSAFYDTRDLEVRSRNNKDDAGIYDPPYAVKHQVGITADRREQSLALKYGNLSQGDSVFAFKTYGDIGNSVGWTLYQEIRFYVHGDLGVEAQNLRAVARFGPDTVNFYEYSIPLRTGWQSVVIPMGRLSGLKERPRTAADSVMVIDRETGIADGSIYSVRGNPSFTRVNRVSFGLTVDGPPTAATLGEVWFDELRLSAVRKDRGMASNVSVQANFSDLLSFNGSYAQQDQDYFRVGLGTNQGSGLNHTAVGLSSTLNLDRFIPTSGVQLPVRVSMQHSTDVPKFRTGSDVILNSARSSIETSELTRQSVDISYRRTSPTKGIARYTLDAISGSMAYARQGSVSPQSSDSSWSLLTNTTYSVPIGGNGVRLGPLRVNPVPRTVTLTADWASTRTASYSRTLEDTTVTQEVRSDALQRILTLSTTSSFEFLQGIRTTYNLRSTRDMLIHQASPFGFNRGTEIRHEQNVDVNWRPRWFTLLQPEITLRGSYSENASPEVRLLASDPIGLKTIQNAGSAHTNITVPLSRLAGRRPTARDTTRSFAPLAPLRFFFSRMQDVSATFDMNRSAVLSRISGNPGLAFQSGFTQVFDESAVTIFSNSTFQTSRRYSTRANTSFKPVEKLTFDIHGDYLLTYSDLVGGAIRTAAVSWPDVNARWTDLQRLLGMSGTLTSLTLNSWYQGKSQESGPSNGTIDQRIQTHSFTPLLGWEAAFKNGIRTSVSSSVEKSLTTDNRAANFFRDRMTKTTGIQVNKTYPAAKGIKFPWNKKRVRLPNDVNLGIQATLATDRTVLHQVGVRDYVEQDTGRLNVGSSTNYNFSRSISGGFNLAFRQSKDNKSNITQRGITVEFTGSFRF